MLELKQKQFHKENPFAAELLYKVPTRNKVTTYGNKVISLINSDGETEEVGFATKRKVDKEEFVKIFAEGILRMFDLNPAGSDLFKSILIAYIKQKTIQTAPDKLTISYDIVVHDCDYKKSERTFFRGMKELIENDFLAIYSTTVYWINPKLFFKGNRVTFMNQYEIDRQEAKQQEIEFNQKTLE